MDVLVLSVFAGVVLAAQFYLGRAAARYFDSLPEPERERLLKHYTRYTY